MRTVIIANGNLTAAEILKNAIIELSSGASKVEVLDQQQERFNEQDKEAARKKYQSSDKDQAIDWVINLLHIEEQSFRAQCMMLAERDGVYFLEPKVAILEKKASDETNEWLSLLDETDFLHYFTPAGNMIKNNIFRSVLKAIEKRKVANNIALKSDLPNIYE